MIKALVNKKIVYASKAESGDIGKCPNCGNPVIARCGEINVKHWSHIDNECPYITEKDNEWHNAWKNKFEKKGYETEKRFGNFIADAFDYKTNTVVEFQHSHITPQDIISRCNYYKSINVNIKWIFDYIDKYNKQNIKLTEKISNNEYDYYYNFTISHQKRGYIQGVTYNMLDESTKPVVPTYFNIIYNHNTKDYKQLRVIKEFNEYKDDMYNNRYRNYIENLNNSIYKFDDISFDDNNVLAELKYDINKAILVNVKKLYKKGRYGWGYLVFV